MVYLILRKFLRENKTEPKPVVIINEEIKESTKKKNKEFLEKNGINVENGLKLLKDPVMYDMTIEQYYEELPGKLEELESFLKEEDMDNYSILVHSLKSESRYIGIDNLADMSYEHELASKEGKIEFIKDNFNILKEEALRIYEVIKKYLGGEK